MVTASNDDRRTRLLSHCYGRTGTSIVLAMLRSANRRTAATTLTAGDGARYYPTI